MIIDAARFFDRLDQSGGPDACHPWLGTIDAYGYGLLYVPRADGGPVTVKAHRAALIIAGVDIDGLCACHHCDNRPCCNARHLFAGTKGDNYRDSIRKGRQISIGAAGDLNPSKVHAERMRRGETVFGARLTAERVVELRSRYAGGGLGYAGIAAEFGIGTMTAWQVIKRRTWAHVP